MVDGNFAFGSGSAVVWNGSCFYLGAIRIGRDGHRRVPIVGLMAKSTE